MTIKEAVERLRGRRMTMSMGFVGAKGYAECQAENEAIEMAIRALTSQAPQPNERATAEWIICSDGYYPYCSHCKQEPPGREMTDYCPKCGAYMKSHNH